ncbi:sulfotransferase family protein [Sphaerimonospora thailandensis]|uniref:Sulfotransferase family protein n=1 Tax=Sphaerimonospora thailandensis TaxID=795644 RepID=A0A8J3R9Q4_9ACTN|nr:sulfotransferase family protein [Sphaerimonospora thailandensis]GIH69957.1 sulfotransferase family protein [Sphaerimonospora thailandensis]
MTVVCGGRLNMIKVIGAGLPRTGTTSLKAALERLGFGPCYHMFEIMAHPEYAEHWLPAGSGSPVDWDRTFEGYRSCVDWPASYFWRELAETYPDAKVVLTVRDPAGWYTSLHALMTNGPRQAFEEHAHEAGNTVMAAVESLRPLLQKIGRSVFEEEWRFGEKAPDEMSAIAAYHRHVAAVRESLPPERLLVFDVRQGWGPLCAFLGVDPPAAEPFPHLNDAESLRRSIEKLLIEGRIPSPFDARN